MDTNIAHKIARAFVHGLAFAKGMATLAQDAKAKMEEGDKGITIGAAPGDDGKKHGGRHVLISGTGEVKAGLSKSAQGKPLGEAVKELKDKAESKKAEKKTEPKAKKSETHSAGALTEKGKALSDLVKKEYGKVENNIRQDFAQTYKDIDKFSDPDFKIPGVDFSADIRIKSGLNSIKNYTESLANQINMTAKEVAHAAEHDDFNRAGVENVWSKIKQLEKKSKNLAGRTDTAMHGLAWMSTNGHEDAARDIAKLKEEAVKLDRESYDLYHEALEAIRQYSRSRPASTAFSTESKSPVAPETHTYSAKELDSMKQKQEGRVKAKKQNAELNRKLKEGEQIGNISFPRNEFRERAKEATNQANQVINDDLKPSVDKLGSEIRRVTDNATMPQSTLNDLTDIHNLAKQIAPMANKLNKYNEKYAAENDDPSNYVISNYGAATKGTAERAAKLARRAAAMSNQLTAPDDERDYSEGRAKQEIRDILTEMRGLHGDLLKKTRHAATAFNTSKPRSSDEEKAEQIDRMYAQKGPKEERIIN